MRLTWDGDRSYGVGVSQGVLYLTGGAYSWNGLISVEENDDEDIDTSNYYDGYRYRITQNVGDFSAKVAAYTYPDEFTEYDGLDEYASNQNRKRFGFSYRTETEAGYQIHIIYSVLANAGSTPNNTMSDGPTLTTFQWDLSTHAEDITWSRWGAHLVIDSTSAYPEALSAVENLLYGSDTQAAYLPTAKEIVELFESFVTFKVTYNGDGTWTADGPEGSIVVDDVTGEYSITIPSAFWMDDNTHQILSY